jgi:hypothetical protein
MYLHTVVHMQMLESICPFVMNPFKRSLCRGPLTLTINPFPSISSRQCELDESYTTVSYSKTNKQEKFVLLVHSKRVQQSISKSVN